MWQALGGLLPIAVAVALSSVPITMTILILLSPNRNRAAIPFLVGWVIGVAAVIVLSTLFASTLPPQPRIGPDPMIVVLWMGIGAALIVLGVINLRRRSQSESESTGLQGWLFRVDSFGVLVSFSVAVLLNLRPKGLLLGMAAGLALHATSVNLDEALDLHRRGADCRITRCPTTGRAPAPRSPQLDESQRPTPDITDHVHDRRRHLGLWAHPAIAGRPFGASSPG